MKVEVSADVWNSMVLLLSRVASINDGKPHNKWVRHLGIEARHLVDKIQEKEA